MRYINLQKITKNPEQLETDNDVLRTKVLIDKQSETISNFSQLLVHKNALSSFKVTSLKQLSMKKTKKKNLKCNILVCGCRN